MFIVVAVIVVVGFWFLFRQSSNGRCSAPLLLAALPLALLFLIVPVPVVAVQSVLAFQTLGTHTNNASVQEAAALALGIVRPFWVGSVGFVLAIGVAAGLQLLVAHRKTRPSEGSPNVDAARPVWGKWILMLSSLLVVPVGILTHLTQGIATLIMQAANGLPLSSAAQDGATVQTARYSELISSRLLVAGFVGFPLLFVVSLFVMANLFAVRFSKTSDALERFSWLIFATVGILAVWNVVVLAISIHSFERALA
jgi:hypothetical protein